MGDKLKLFSARSMLALISIATDVVQIRRLWLVHQRGALSNEPVSWGRKALSNFGWTMTKA
jgi:hypothetical protein